MNRRAEYLVCKRDGRREWLRATKLAHSVRLAMEGAGYHDTWRAVDIAGTVIAGLRSKHGEEESLHSVEIAAATAAVLGAVVSTTASARYQAFAVRKREQQRLMDDLATGDRGLDASVPGSAAALEWPRVGGFDPAHGNFSVN